MTTYTEARNSIVQLVTETLAVSVPVFWENTLEIDLDKVGDHFIKVQVDFDDSTQMTINDHPERRVYGEVVFTLMSKGGTGTLTRLGLIDSIENVVSFTRTTKVQFEVPRVGRKQERDGWVSQDFRAPFFFDSLAWA